MRVVDLTVKVNDHMSQFPDPNYFPPERRFIYDPARDPRYSRYSGSFSICVHTGTHLDTPMHMNIQPFVKTIDKVPLNVLCGPAVVIKLPDVKTGEITSKMLEEHLPANVETKGKRLLVFTGVNDSELWGSEDYFKVVPNYTQDAAEWICDHGFVLVGSDVMTDPVGGSGVVHQTLLSNEIYILEYACGGLNIHDDEVFLVVAPTPLEGMESAPTRAFAIEGLSIN